MNEKTAVGFHVHVRPDRADRERYRFELSFDVGDRWVSSATYETEAAALLMGSARSRVLSEGVVPFSRARSPTD